MTQEEKQLLLKDLCARLLCGVKFESYDNIPIVEYCVCDKVFVHEQGYVIIDLLDKDANGNTLASTSINLTTVSRLPKPYLRSLSSMTDEEKKIICSMNMLSDIELSDRLNYPKMYVQNYTIETFDLFNTHNLDYRGLIEKELALEAPEGMYMSYNEKHLTTEDIIKKRDESIRKYGHFFKNKDE